MTVRIYGELYDVGINFFDDVEILEVTDYTNTVFIKYIKGDHYKDKIITLSNLNVHRTRYFISVV